METPARLRAFSPGEWEPLQDFSVGETIMLLIFRKDPGCCVETDLGKARVEAVR